MYPKDRLPRSKAQVGKFGCVRFALSACVCPRGGGVGGFTGLCRFASWSIVSVRCLESDPFNVRSIGLYRSRGTGVGIVVK